MQAMLKHILTSAAIALSLSATLAHAQTYPIQGKPITIVVPTAPGGGNDTMGRIIAQKLAERLKASVIVENKAGGNGIIGSQYVARAAGDGHTILFGYIATHGINPALSKLPYDAVKDFAPVTLVADAPGVLAVNPNVPAKNVKELIALAKAKPNDLNYGSAGSGTAPHIAGEMFKLMTGISMTHVPYKGSAPAMTDLLGNQVQVMFPSLVAATPHMKTGRLRALAVTGKTRSSLYPSLPTVAESGVPGFEIGQWYGLLVPAKTPRPIVDKLNKEVIAVMKDPEVVKKFHDQGAEVVTSSPEEFGKFIQSEIAKWTKIIQDAKITVE